MEAKIVGVRYYNGHVTSGEMCLLVREPSNQYDVNAIRVDNVRGQKIGHIARGNAAKLAPFMDSQALLVECATTGEKEYFDCPIALSLYGSNDPTQRELLKDRMKNFKLPIHEFMRREREEKARLKVQQQREKERLKALKAAKKGGMSMPGGAGGMAIPAGGGTFAGGSFQSGIPNQTLDDIMQESERFNPRNIEQAVEQFGLKEEDLAKMEMADQPKAIRTKMLPYQLQGLKWMLQKENPIFPPLNSKDVVQLWRRVDRSPKTITNMATNFSLLDKLPDLASGGILADDMGLGKTIQVISLLLADSVLKKQADPGVSAATLILAPLSVMSNWSTQIEKHVKDKYALRVSTYHGQKRFFIDSTTIAEHDVVITTYETMTSEYWGKNKKPSAIPRKDGLFSVTWRRLVLDEGHSIRNPAAMKSVAACNLLARSRWILTGTPIVNTLKDL
jgi:SWI/SNF-related matrix-associated actin-dependent regulator of chromatin subfamily A3